MRGHFSDKDVMALPAPQILIADDEPAILDVMGQKLRRVGFEVLNALDGQEALQLAKLRVPSLIVLDECMPAMTGLEVCERLARSQVTADIPVILLTGLAIQRDVPPNVRRVVAKPFSTRTIIQAIQEILATPAET